MLILLSTARLDASKTGHYNVTHATNVAVHRFRTEAATPPPEGQLW
jgi:hypothetical protein